MQVELYIIKLFVFVTGDGSCGLNVHNAGAHLADFVEGWGPLWAWSCFGFEDMNGTILEFVHGTGNACRQVEFNAREMVHFTCKNSIFMRTRIEDFVARCWKP